MRVVQVTVRFADEEMALIDQYQQNLIGGPMTDERLQEFVQDVVHDKMMALWGDE